MTILPSYLSHLSPPLSLFFWGDARGKGEEVSFCSNTNICCIIVYLLSLPWSRFRNLTTGGLSSKNLTPDNTSSESNSSNAARTFWYTLVYYKFSNAYLNQVGDHPEVAECQRVMSCRWKMWHLGSLWKKLLSTSPYKVVIDFQIAWHSDLCSEVNMDK